MAINLLALNLVKDAKNQKEKIAILASFGFGPSELAKMLGTSANTVSVALSEIKKGKKAQEVIQSQAESKKTDAVTPTAGKDGKTNA